jgi:hypothetical protein
MATIRQLEESIFSKEEFRVTLEPLPGASKNLPPYDVEYPAYNCVHSVLKSVSPERHGL